MLHDFIKGDALYWKRIGILLKINKRQEEKNRKDEKNPKQ
jgi:hypothetical protein